MTHEHFDNGQTFPLKFHFKYLHKKSLYLYFSKKTNIICCRVTFIPWTSLLAKLFTSTCAYGGMKEVEVEGRRNRSVKSSSELGKKSASESESEGRGQWCKNLCFHALDTEHHTELLGTSPL